MKRRPNESDRVHQGICKEERRIRSKRGVVKESRISEMIFIAGNSEEGDVKDSQISLTDLKIRLYPISLVLHHRLLNNEKLIIWKR